MGEVTCYFHMGKGKTGTSAIQAFLDTNRKILLKEHNCLYPTLLSFRPDKGKLFNHATLFKRTTQIYKTNEDKIRKVKKIINFAKRKNVSTVVFSFEAISDHLNLFKDFFIEIASMEDVNVKGILYFRRQDHFYSSAWKQWGIKSEHNSIEEYIEKHGLSNWYRSAKMFKNWVGPNSMIVKVYEKQQLPGGLIPDFLKTIGVDPKHTEWKTPKATNRNVNPGFSRDVLEYLYLTKDLADDVHDNTLFDLVFESLGEKYQKLPFENYDFLSPQQRIAILEKYEAMNRKIAIEFLGRKDGRLFLEPYPDPDEPWDPYPGLSVEALAQILTGIILDQNKYRRPIKSFFEKLIRKIKALF